MSGMFRLNLQEADVMNLYRFLIIVALIFAMGCAGGPSTATTSSSSDFTKLCKAIGAKGGKLEREKFIAHSRDKEAAAKLFDYCDTQHKGYLTEEDVTPANMNLLKGQAFRSVNP
jgi:hypothetical protein